MYHYLEVLAVDQGLEDVLLLPIGPGKQVEDLLVGRGRVLAGQVSQVVVLQIVDILLSFILNNRFAILTRK